MLARPQRHEIADAVREHRRAREQIVDLRVREEEDVAGLGEAPVPHQPVADREDEPAQPAVEQRLLQAGALPKPDRSVGRPEESVDDDAERRSGNPADERAPPQLGEHALGLAFAQGGLLEDHVRGRSALHRQVETDHVDERSRILLEARHGEHQLPGAAEAPCLEVAVPRRAHGRRGRQRLERGGDRRARLARMEAPRKVRRVAKQARQRPEHLDGLAAHDVREALEEGVVERSRLVVGKRAAEHAREQPVHHHRGGVGERGVLPLVAADPEKSAKILEQLVPRLAAEEPRV